MARRPAAVPLALVLAALACGQSRPAAPAPSPDRPAVSRLPVVMDGAAAAPRARPGDFNALSARKTELGAPARRVTPAAGATMDARLGVPSFLWAAPAKPSAASLALARPRSAAEAARAHLRAQAPAYGLAAGDVSAATVAGVHDTGFGPVIVKFRQAVGGVEVFREQAAVAMDRDWNLVAISGSLSPSSSAKAALPSFTLSEADAIAAALTDVTGEAFSPADLAAGARSGPYLHADLAAGQATARGERFTRPARAKQTWFRLPSGLEPAYYVEVGLERAGDVEPLEYGYVVSARSGRVLFRKDQLAYDAFTYRVWAQPAAPFLPDDGPQGNAATPHPTGTPDGFQAAMVPQAVVTLQNAPFSHNDPWLPATATVATGNNAEAYADVSGADGFDATDVRGTLSGPLAFEYAYDFGVAPNGSATQVQAALAQLFYDVNFFHDWYYDAGFDEAAGNAQADNFGRGGFGGDSLRAEAQDSSGVNNANMSTPSDGLRPRMQMYLFSGNGAQALRVEAPAALAAIDYSGVGLPGVDIAGVAAGFGAQAFQLTGDLVQPVDGSGNLLGCNPVWTNAAAMAGKIALVDRGVCGFAVKAANAQANGAAGVVIANATAAQTFGNMGGVDAAVTIPALLVQKPIGDGLRGALANGPATVTMIRADMLQRDGTIDNTIVAHEWGHYISNRLVHDAAGLDNNQGRSMGEGWGDTHALLMAVRPEDAALPINVRYSGVYGLAGFVTSGLEWYGAPNQGYYFGIRRVPYSTDLSKDPLTFRHVANGNPIGTAAPILFDWDGAFNSEVHNAGEVWATLLWECYAALLDDPRYTFQQAQDRWKAYLVAAYKLTPASPTFLEGRDALLAAAKATDEGDWRLFWAAFAKRGAGAGAVGPDRFSVEHTPVVESYVAGKVLGVVAASFGGVETACDDGDAILDDGETGTVTLTLRNLGTDAVGAVTATVSSPNGHVTFPAGTQVAIPATDVGATVTARVKVALAGAAPFEELPLVLSFAAADADAPASITLRGNLDEAPASSDTETFEALRLAWTPAFDAALSTGQFGWTRFEVSPSRHEAYAPDLGYGSDLTLTSPPLDVAGPLAVSFAHRHDFEWDSRFGDYYDGGVVEVSADWGATWTDVGGAAYAGHLLATYPGNPNPLAGRPAFGGRNASWPENDTVTLDLGAAYAGKTVLLRFRAGSDAGTAAEGWHVDDVRVTGLAGTPFASLVADRRACVASAPLARVAAASQSVDEGAAVTLDASASSDVNPGTALTFQWTQVSGPPVTLANASGAVATFTAPQVTAETALVFSVTVSDGARTGTASTTVVVRNVNQPPVASAGADLEVNEGAVTTIDGTASADPDGTVLTFEWVQVGSPGVTLLGPAQARPSFVAPAVTEDTTLAFTLTVSDGTASSSATVHVTVKNVNVPPVAVAGVDFSVDERTQVVLDGGASSDADGDPLTYAWSRVSGPPVTFTGADTATAIFTAPEVTADDTLVIRLTVGDGTATSHSDVTIHVRQVNRQPLARIAAVGPVAERSTVTLDGSASSDDDGDVLTYAWEQISGPVVALSSATAPSPTFTAPEVKGDTELVFQLTVRDPSGVADSATRKVVVTNVDKKDKGGCATGGDAGLVGLFFLGLATLRRRARRG